MAEAEKLAERVEKLRKTAERRVAKLTDIVEDLRREVEDRAFGMLDAARGRALFKARMGKAGRIVIPEAEREALGLEEGHFVQIALRKLKRSKK